MSSSFADTLNALLRLITMSVREVISAYEDAGQSAPSLNSVDPGPFDSPQDRPLHVTKAFQIIEGACAQLCATIAPPGHIMLNKALLYTEPVCLQVAIGAKISDLLLNKPEGLHVDELAELSGLNATKLGQVLRLLATKHVYHEVKSDVYANNRLSIKLLSTDPASSTVGSNTDEYMKTAVHLWDALQDKEYGHTFSSEKSTFQKVYGAPAFQYYAEHPALEQRFSTAMIGWGNIADRGVLTKLYPWSDLPEETLICDVGGSTGHATLDVVKVYPQLQVVVQDLATVQPRWEELWSKDLPEALQRQRVKFVPIDFLKETPVQGSDFYYLRHVLHDWPTAECITILSNVKAAMKPSSRVLIHENVLQATARSSEPSGLTSENIAPEPLLPNYGAGRIRRYGLDVVMMCALNGRERTLQEFIDIGTQAGLMFLKLWDSGEAGLVEFEL